MRLSIRRRPRPRTSVNATVPRNGRGGAIAVPAVSAPACLTQIGLIDLVADSVEAYVETADDIGT
jgi:hypothetical protein